MDIIISAIMEILSGTRITITDHGQIQGAMFPTIPYREAIILILKQPIRTT
jgi:hypothetical protein